MKKLNEQEEALRLRVFTIQLPARKSKSSVRTDNPSRPGRVVSLHYLKSDAVWSEPEEEKMNLPHFRNICAFILSAKSSWAAREPTGFHINKHQGATDAVFSKSIAVR